MHHARPEWLPGGWLGVDVFFVLSGFLITSLLLARPSGLGRFWERRVRRILPALLVLVAVLAVGAAVSDDGVRFRGLRGDGLAALASVVNWRFVAGGETYFEGFAEPSLLRHLWSLSVEAQYYLVWPLVLVAALRLGRRSAFVVTLGLAAASAVAMALHSDVTRAYFGSDTHAHGLLLGSALALTGWRPARGARAAVAGWSALGVLGAAVVLLDGTDPVAYRGGIAAAGLVAAVLVAVAPATGPLSLAPLRALGRISYGVYLWHWPVLQLLDTWVLPAQLALTLALAAASWYLVERPVLTGRVRLAVVPAAGAVAVAVAALAVLAAPAPAPQAPAVAAAATRSAEQAAPADPRAGVLGHRVLVVGDSVAYTLFPGLAAHEDAAGLELLTAAETGCPLDLDAEDFVDHDGPVRLDRPSHCDWRRSWPGIVDRTRPGLVVGLWGLWDVLDHVVDGERLVPGTDRWHRHMEATLEEAVEILGAHGARVAVLTTPYVHSLDPARVDALNAVFQAVAARRDDVVVLDIRGAAADPAATRWDAVHFTGDGAGVVGGHVVPELVRIARFARPGGPVAGE